MDMECRETDARRDGVIATLHVLNPFGNSVPTKLAPKESLCVALARRKSLHLFGNSSHTPDELCSKPKSCVFVAPLLQRLCECDFSVEDDIPHLRQVHATYRFEDPAR